MPQNQRGRSFREAQPAGGTPTSSPRLSPPTAVKDHAVYERKIDIPAAAAGKVVKVLFGGCNYGAEVFLDGRKVTERRGLAATPTTGSK